MDLADPAQGLQMAGEIGAAHRDADAVVALGERSHHVAAEETRAAEDRDQGVGISLRGHRLPFGRAFRAARRAAPDHAGSGGRTAVPGAAYRIGSLLYRATKVRGIGARAPITSAAREEPVPHLCDTLLTRGKADPYVSAMPRWRNW